MIDSERTLVIIKPDALQRNLVSEVLSRFEKKGLKLVGLKMMQLGDSILKDHYRHILETPFYKEFTTFMQSTPVVLVCLEGLKAVEMVRHISGTDNFQQGSIRGDFSSSFQRNVIHSSDSIESAKVEIDRFFDTSELFDYEKYEWKSLYAESDKS